MIIPDINLLVYAYDNSVPAHRAAARWWEELLSAVTPVGIPHLVLFGFTRLITNPRVVSHPKSIAETASFVRSWIAQPNVQIIQPGDGHTDRVLDLLQQINAGGNLVSDAQLAALAIEHHAVLHTADADFLRFPGVRWFNPITGISSDKLRRR
jgi:toxin-antitoxin system PIN domain toxin